MLGTIPPPLRRFIRRGRAMVYLRRPLGLVALGPDSVVFRPASLSGRRRISIGARSTILPHSLIHALESYAQIPLRGTVSIGDGVYIGRHAYVVAARGIEIGSGSVLSEHVYITDLNHGFNPAAGPIMAQPLSIKGPVIIGRNCFLGYRVAVMSGVTLGDWCIVGANSVVTRSFPAYSMIGGVPARLIREYSPQSGEWLRIRADFT